MKDINYQANDLRESLIQGHQRYSGHLSQTLDLTPEDFANVYFANIQLLDRVERQDQLIKDIYDILERHESQMK